MYLNATTLILLLLSFLFSIVVTEILNSFVDKELNKGEHYTLKFSGLSTKIGKFFSILAINAAIFLFATDIASVSTHFIIYLISIIHISLVLFACITIFMSDIKDKYILNISSFALGFASVLMYLVLFFAPDIFEQLYFSLMYGNYISHILSVAITLLLFGGTYIINTNAIGLGDVLLLSIISTTLKITDYILVLNIALISASIYAIALYLITKDKNQHFALGPFISTAYMLFILLTISQLN